MTALRMVKYSKMKISFQYMRGNFMIIKHQLIQALLMEKSVIMKARILILMKEMATKLPLVTSYSSAVSVARDFSENLV